MKTVRLNPYLKAAVEYEDVIALINAGGTWTPAEIAGQYVADFVWECNDQRGDSITDVAIDDVLRDLSACGANFDFGDAADRAADIIRMRYAERLRKNTTPAEWRALYSACRGRTYSGSVKALDDEIEASGFKEAYITIECLKQKF